MKLIEKTGRVVYLLIWPGMYLLMPFTTRTRVVIVAGGKLLLTRSWINNGCYTLPGGGLKRKEPAIIGAIREVNEETKITLQPNQLKFLSNGKVIADRIKFNYEAFYCQLPRSNETGLKPDKFKSVLWLPLDRAQRLVPLSDDTKTILKIHGSR